MVHLASVKSDAEAKTALKKRFSIVPGMEHISLEPPSADDFSTSVYGSRFASEDLSTFELPEKEMPKEIAYRMIKDELSLDGNPMLKCAKDHATRPWNYLLTANSLASFVTTYMVHPFLPPRSHRNS